MIYTKNNSEEPDYELFANPTAEYRGIPFWSWNCKVTEELIDWHMAGMVPTHTEPQAISGQMTIWCVRRGFFHR